VRARQDRQSTPGIAGGQRNPGADGFAAGNHSEKVTTRGINVNGLPVGQRLRVGEAQMEVSVICTPCDLLEKIRPGLRRELRGRRGMLCRVVAGGMIRRGDNIERIS
jgi:MOSC domain-containing protein YiiM